MTTPSRSEAAALLLALDAPPSLVRHMSAVAEIAAFLAVRIAARGLPVDRRLVETAALLHDLDKALPFDDPLRRLGHGHAGAEWLAHRGLTELAPAVASHPVTRLTGPGADRWLECSTREERIVAYADKRAAQHLGSMDARFARWFDRHPEHAGALRLARGRAAILEHDVCEAADLEPASVARLRWVRGAFLAARATGPLLPVAGRVEREDA